MNVARSLSLILASVFSCHGEIFISSTNQANSLTIAANEALLISAAERNLKGPCLFCLAILAVAAFLQPDLTALLFLTTLTRIQSCFLS